MSKIIPLLLIAAILIQCKPSTQDKEKTTERGLIGQSAMVVSAREEASEVGLAILKKGGNAFDAMVATDLSLLVSFPFAGNIGGGGFMVYRLANGECGAIDYREKAPFAASHDMYLDEQGNVIPGKSTLGAMAIGVPGTIAGLFAVHEKLGSLPMKDLIQPAIDLATNGVVVTEKQANRLNHYRHLFSQANKRTILLDKEWTAGDTIRYPELAETLTRIRDHGKDEFYKGKTAQLLVDYVQQLGGIITMDDLAAYEAKWRTPITFTYNGNKIISMPPPSSGGICLAQILKSIEPFNISQYGQNSVQYIQLLTEAERRAYADRAHFLGDPDFVDIPTDSLIDPAYLNQRMADFSWEKASRSTDISHGELNAYESNETTHYSIVDSMGNAVSVTTTLNGAYGSKVYVAGAGFFLNNEMDDFSSKPGTPNMFGLVGAEANAIAPEKRMLSSMTPTIVEQGGKLKMVVGTPGGSTIITSVAQNILNVLDYDMGMQESVSQPRFHHQWLPDDVRFEPGFDTLVFAPLRDLGYNIDQSNSPIIGKVDAVLLLPDGSLEGGADPRGDDKAAGF
ncbi:gamma-glutamyltransferase [Mangrovibacterium diazotrophicum]|uniref:Glutathione hydrolase proenzyme n=1 Tax=Mangrovibacterium diazotrophicum TaxID=1261403 RepID=A0A419W3X0_9BACT|nr:gamma-glutamyltransferase [Mangrovibacterium diazotrophicum]RKD90162.1 gamma-glutamyltranspeptidase/glutathione hydrolase [Mangrovibacterium diazotrophicum]